MREREFLAFSQENLFRKSENANSEKKKSGKSVQKSGNTNSEQKTRKKSVQNSKNSNTEQNSKKSRKKVKIS